MKTKVLMLGSSGMLGSMVLDYLSKQDDLKIIAPSRKQLINTSFKGYDYIINCIGIIKQKLTNPQEAILINSLLPYEIAKDRSKDCKVIQIATDCVFAGKKGHYVEDDEHDATDIYGKTKSLGEVKARKFFNIRTSIIGLDKEKKSLLSWFLSQKKVKGYTNHYWNGITTLHFAKLCYAIIKKHNDIPNLIHFVPATEVSKYELLKLIAKYFNKDIKIEKQRDIKTDKTLFSKYGLVNLNLWHRMGYDTPQSIEDMVKEFAEYVKK